MIDNEIELKVLKIRGNQVHLGIDAPKKSAVHRKEVWLRIQNDSANDVDEGVGAPKAVNGNVPGDEAQSA